MPQIPLVRRGTDPALWEQVVRTLTEELRPAAPGDRLASESAMCARFGVSRMTLRQALAELERYGVVHPQVGRGWFVGGSRAVPVSEDPGALQSFTEMARRRGLRPDSSVLHLQRRPADWNEAGRLGIAPGAELLSLRRLRRLDDCAVAVDHSLVPSALLPDSTAEEFRDGSLYAALERHGVRPTRADYEVQAVAADGEQAGLLGVAVGAPLLAATQVCTDQHGRAVELGQITYRGDRYRFHAVLHA